MNIVGYMAFSAALYLVRERFLHVSWRWMLISTTVTLVALDVPFTMLTIFDVVRNQYFCAPTKRDSNPGRQAIRSSASSAAQTVGPHVVRRPRRPQPCPSPPPPRLHLRPLHRPHHHRLSTSVPSTALTTTAFASTSVPSTALTMTALPPGTDLSETLVTELPDAIFFVVSCFVIVELAGANNEGLVYGLLTTISNVGKSVPNALSNQIFAQFWPPLSDEANYVPARGGDQLCFRRVVALSFAVSYAFGLGSLLTMPLMPDQKADCQRRITTWPRRTSYAVATVAIVLLGLTYSVGVNVLALTPLACLRIVGGQGCDDDGGDATGTTHNATVC